MSAKAFDALSKSSDVSSVPQTAQSQVNQNDEDRNKLLAIRKKNLIRFGSLAVLAFVVWLFATIAWFASNKDVTASNMQIKTATMPFDIATRGSHMSAGFENRMIRYFSTSVSLVYARQSQILCKRK